ncbi:type III polyketide synthase [Alsobacter sp. KACC 23698]|uniref:Type III polyketide synthase n=1 Tax=Alsobacter sp. KACC 23698 TaxID=3149229 RepID=A0AAU7JAZ3_9HYPH
MTAPLSPRLLSVATASPPHVLHQSEVTMRARDIFGRRQGEFDRIAPVFENAGIRTRRSVQPIAWYSEPAGWPERTRAYLEGGCDLFIAAAQNALDKAGLQASDVDTVVTVSSTGIATPSLEARAAERLGLRPDVARIPVFGLGCAGGVTGLGLAAKLAKATPGSLVLLVCVELCTLSFRGEAFSKANIVATALFGDGAAAALVRAGDRDGAVEITGSAEHQWPGTLDIMGWDVDAEGLGVVFAKSIPPFAEEHLGAAMEGLLARMGLAREDVGRFACHPGGAKVITALERSLGLPQGELDIERDVLSEFGNMSAPTALFVLDRVLERPGPDVTVLTAMGPGFTASACALARVA